MTISSTNRKAGPYAGNDVAVAFPFSFKVLSAADVYAVRADSSGAETDLTLTTDYTVALNADQNANPGGTLTLPAALASSYTLTISSKLDYLQPTDLTNNGGFYPKVITNALDRLTILCQQLYEQIGRSLKLAVSVPPGVKVTLPVVVPGTVLGWNAAGDGFANYSPASAVSDSVNVTFIQSGAGAVSRLSRDKMRESVSVSDYSTIAQAIAQIGTSGRQIDLVGQSVTLTAEPSNPYGVRVKAGKVLVPSLISGQSTQINTYADDVNGIMIGRENLAAFMLATSAGTANNIFIYGDSTVEMNAAYIPKAHGLVKYALYEAGINWTETVNRGVSGTSWSDLNAIADLATTTKLIVIKYGINDAVKSNALATLAADARSKLTAIRGAANGAYDKLSILLMGPSSCYAPTTGQDAKWFEYLRNIYLQLCKEFDCSYFDTYAYLQSTRRAPALWLDDFTGIGRPGEGVHPTPDAAWWIWYEGFKRFVLGDGTWNRNKANHFWNRGGSVPNFTALPSDPPQLFPMGISIDYVTAANGWPAPGMLTTVRSGASGNNGDVRQELTTLDIVPRKFTRTGILLTWTQWTNVPTAVSAFLNSWANKGGGYNSAGYTIHDDGFIELYGTITGGTLGAAVFLLPTNARPANAHLFYTAGGTGYGTPAVIAVFGDGNVYANAASNATVSLDGCRFRYGA